MHHGADYTPWEGYAVTGWPVKTLLRGEVVFDDGKIVGAVSGLVQLLWYLILLGTTVSSPTKQGIHDKQAHTMVVKAARMAA